MYCIVQFAVTTYDEGVDYMSLCIANNTIWLSVDPAQITGIVYSGTRQRWSIYLFLAGTIKMVTNDDDTMTDLTVEGDREEIERMRKELGLMEKGKVYVKGILEQWDEAAWWGEVLGFSV